MNDRIMDLVHTVAELDDSLQRAFVESLFGAFGEKERFRFVQWVCHCAYPKTRWSKVERWMEGQFRRDMSKTPRKTASIAINYFRINPKMLPFLIKTAQRIKLRVRARRRLHPEEFEDLRDGETDG